MVMIGSTLVMKNKDRRRFVISKSAALGAGAVAACFMVAAAASKDLPNRTRPTAQRPANSAAVSLAKYAPPIVGRESWQARPALAGMKEQMPKEIILHNTGVVQNTKVVLEKKMYNLQAFSQRPGLVSPNHMKPAWPDVPYHFYIDVFGRIAEGRDVRFAGDTNTNYNTVGFIQVVVEGEFDEEMPNAAQMSALEKLLAWLLLSWNIPMESVSVHKDHAETTCPGRNFMALLPGVLAAVKVQRSQIISEVCSHEPEERFSATYCL
jgi:hypothetical protein